MFDFTLALVEIGEFLTEAQGFLDTSTVIGGLFVVGLGAMIIMGVARRFKRIIPR